MLPRIILLLIIITGLTNTIFAQKLQYNRSYIESHRTDLTLKAFGGYKFSGYKLDQRGFNKAVKYKSNDDFNTGIGFNYRWLGLSIAIRMPLVNNDNSRFGKTKMLDLQSYIYSRKYAVDIYGQFYKGYYLKNSEVLTTPLQDGRVVIRADLETKTVGANVQYIFNHRRFSYRAAYVQNEYQKKSAGSALVGVGIHHFSINADSAIIPAAIIDKNLFNNNRFNHSRIFSMAVNAGYAYTRVVRKHYFFTGALIGGLGSNITSLTDDNINTKDRKTSWQLNGSLRLATGYNSKRYFAGLQYIHFAIKSATPFAGSWQEFESGYFKLTVAKRFGVKKNMIKEAYDTMQSLTP